MASAEQLKITLSVEGRVMGVDERAQGIVHKLDDTTRLSSPVAHPLIPNAYAYLQGTCSATIFFNGFRLRIHP